MNVGLRIKQRRKELGYSADFLAERLGVSRSTIFRYENGDIDKLPVDVLTPLAEALQTTPAFLMGWEEEASSKIPSGNNIFPIGKGSRIPLYGRIACGAPILAVEDLEETAWLPEGIKADFALTCCGDSMINARIFDGDIVAAGHMPSDAGNSKMIAYIDGKKVGDCWNKNFWKLIDGSAAGTKKIWGLNIAFSAENAERYEKFIAELIADGTSDDVKAYRANKKSEAREEEIAYAKETIAAAEAQSDIPTAKEARARQIQYNDIHNEGGEGYVPRWVSKEEYENAKSILANQ